MEDIDRNMEADLDEQMFLGVTEADKYILENIKTPGDVTRILTYSKYIANACFKILKDTGLPRRDIDILSKNLDSYTKELVEENIKIKMEE